MQKTHIMYITHEKGKKGVLNTQKSEELNELFYSSEKVSKVYETLSLLQSILFKII